MQQHELQAKRLATGLSQQELGERIGLSKASARPLMSAYETGNSRNKLDGPRLILISKALQLAAKLKKEQDAAWQKFSENNPLV